MNLDAVMDDLAARFLIHLLPEEIDSTERLLFQVEEAHWFYEDFYRRHYKLPYTSFRNFAIQILKHIGCTDTIKELEEELRRFTRYKREVPVFGGLLFNSLMTKILLVEGYRPKSIYTFPRGKISRGETELECAVREVYEEVGYDTSKKMLQQTYIDMSTVYKTTKLFVVMNVPENTRFQTQTRGEIKNIAWVSLADIEKTKLPSLCYAKTYIKEIKQVMQRIKQYHLSLNHPRLRQAFGVTE